MIFKKCFNKISVSSLLRAGESAFARTQLTSLGVGESGNGTGGVLVNIFFRGLGRTAAAESRPRGRCDRSALPRPRRHRPQPGTPVLVRVCNSGHSNALE